LSDAESTLLKPANPWESQVTRRNLLTLYNTGTGKLVTIG
jgi:hypothetical protein